MTVSLPARIRAAWAGFTGSSPTAFDAAGMGPRLQPWQPPPANWGSIRQPSQVLWRARDLFRNNPFARRCVEATVSAGVSTGIKPMVMSPDVPRKQATQEAFLDWTDACDFDQRRDFYGFQADVLRNLLVDGECLVILSPTGRGEIPLELKLLACEFLDRARVQIDKVMDGIEYGPDGKRVAYWIYPRANPAGFPNFQSVRVPADQVLHIFSPIAPGVPRGVSWLEPAMTAMHELQSFLEAELVRSRTASLYCGYIQTPSGAVNLPTTDGTLAMEPGSLFRLQPEENIVFSTPPESRYFEPYVRCQLRSIASALNMPYELLASDVSQVTFASGRHSLLAWKRWIETLQNHVLVYQLCRPVWDAWVRYALLSGVLDGSPEDYEVRWIAPPLEMLDAQAEVQAVVKKVRAGFLSRTEAVAQTGLDAEALEVEMAAEQRRADALELVFDSDARQTTQQGQEQPSLGVEQQPVAAGGGDATSGG
jgi:lambda family phage portal protein